MNDSSSLTEKTMKPKIFIDGQEGTTGLKLHDLLIDRTDLQLLQIDPEKRKDPAERAKLLNAADIVFLCLPEPAAKEALTLITNDNTRVIDASTAHRTHPEWAYGLPELSPAHRNKIKNAKRIANPGCHATAFLLAIYPLVANGDVSADFPLTCFSLTGYSGGGKKMIAQYQAPDAPEKLKGPRPYALALSHKHLPEMQTLAGLKHPPLFTPIVANVYQGLAVQIFLPPNAFKKKRSLLDVKSHLVAHYANEPFINVMPDPQTSLDDGQFDITACNNTNRADIFVLGNDQQIVLLTRLDNLGKGASGAAIQSMNLLLNLPETTALTA
jgi:N-acetyl-gamma-glutamyl-phosphate reductase